MVTKLRAYAVTDKNVTVNFDNGETHILARTDALADKLIKALREGRSQDIPELVSAAKRIEKYGQGNFKVQEGCIHINGQPVPEVLSRKIIKFQQDNLPYEPLVRFAENLQKNSSYRAVNELFQFLEKNDHPITENGCFIAYKKVREDFKDAYTGTLDNSPGTVVEMPRNQVNEDPTQTCSYGLHVANWYYAHSIYQAGSNANMLEVEVDPADVVAVPTDYDQAKMRVCKYKVLGVVEKEHSVGTPLRITDSVDLGPPPNHCCHNDDCCSDSGEADEEENNDCVCCGGYSDGNDYCDDCREEGCDDEDEYPWEDELD